MGTGSVVLVSAATGSNTGGRVGLAVLRDLVLVAVGGASEDDALDAELLAVLLELDFAANHDDDENGDDGDDRGEEDDVEHVVLLEDSGLALLRCCLHHGELVKGFREGIFDVQCA